MLHARSVHRRVRRAAAAVALAAALAAAILAFHPGPAETAFPGANGKIVFESTYDDAPQGHLASNRKVYAMNPDSSGLTRLTHGDADSVDALKVLRHVAALPVSQTEPCPDVGSEVQVTEP